MQGIDSFLVHFSQSLFSFIERKEDGRFFFAYLIGVCVFFSLFFALPSYDIAFSEENRENWLAILSQAKKPLTQSHYGDASHQANLAFRLTPAIIGNFLNFTSVTSFLILQFLCLVALLSAISGLFKKITDDTIVSSLLTLAVSFTFVGNVLCSDYRGFFDVIAFMFMAIAMYVENRFLIVASLFLSYFTDERALIAAGLIFLYFSVGEILSVRRLLHSKAFLVILSVVLYLVSRLTISFVYGLSTNSSGLLKYLVEHSIHQINLLPIGLWTGLEGFWILVSLSILVLLLQKRIIFFGLVLLAMVPVIFVAMWVFDITRSMAYLFPVIFISVTILSKHISVMQLRYLSLSVLLICLFPTYYAGGANSIQWFYPLPLQLVRMLAQ